MKIMIIGAGYTGVQLAKRLIDEKNEVTLIDNDASIVTHVSNRVNANVVLTNGNDLEELEKNNLKEMDALVVLTENDETNMITCSLVDSVYPDLPKIARVRNYAYYNSTNQVTKSHSGAFSNKQRPLYGIDFMINPDFEAAEAIVKAVEHGAVSDIYQYGEKFSLTSLEVSKNSKLKGVAIKDIRNLTPYKFIVVYVETKEGSSLPAGDTVLHAGDRIGILTENESIDPLLEFFGAKIDSFKKIVLVGAGRIGSIIAERLTSTKQEENKPQEKATLWTKLKSISMKKKREGIKNLVIVDSDKALCTEAIEKFPQIKVLCGDITDESLIQDEKLDEADLVISATHNHEMNLVIAAFMESLGVEKTVALVERSTFADIARKLSIEVPVPLRDTIIDSIMSHLRGKNVRSIHTVSNGDFEIVECDIASSSKWAGKTLKDAAKAGEYLMLLIKKAGAQYYEIPHGNTVLNPGDHIVLIEKTGDKQVQERFSGES